MWLSGPSLYDIRGRNALPLTDLFGHAAEDLVKLYDAIREAVNNTLHWHPYYSLYVWRHNDIGSGGESYSKAEEIASYADRARYDLPGNPNNGIR